MFGSHQIAWGFSLLLNTQQGKKKINVETFGLLCMGQSQEAGGCFLCPEVTTKKQCGLFRVLLRVCVVLLFAQQLQSSVENSAACLISTELSGARLPRKQIRCVVIAFSKVFCV